MGRRRTLSFGRKKYNDVGPGDDLPATAAYMNTLESLRDTIHDSTLFHCKQAHVEGDHVAYHPILLLVEREGLHILDPETEIELHFHPFNVIRYFRVKANRMYQIVEEHRGSDGKVARVGYTFRLKSDVERGNLKTIIDSYVQDKMEALQRKAEENKARKKKTMSRYNSQDNVVHETASGRVYLDANHPYLQAAKETQWLRFWSEEEQAHFYHNQETAETTWAEPDAWKDGEKLLEEQQRRSGQAEASSASTAPAASPTVATGDLISVGTPNEATPSTPPRTRALQGQDGDAPASPRPDTPSKAWADFANETPHAAARWDPLSDPFGLAGGSQPVVQPSAAANASNPFAAFASNAPGTTSTAPPSATGGRPPTGRPPTGRLPPSGRRPPTASTGSNNPFAIAPPPSPGDSRRASRRRISNPKTPAEVGLALNTGTATATTAATTTTAAAGNNNNPFANSGTPGRTRSQSLDVNLTDLLF